MSAWKIDQNGSSLKVFTTTCEVTTIWNEQYYIAFIGVNYRVLSKWNEKTKSCCSDTIKFKEQKIHEWHWETRSANQKVRIKYNISGKIIKN